MKVHLKFDEGGDWVAIYKDGVKQAENHSLSERDVLEAVGIEFTSETVEVDYDTGACPDGSDPFPETL